ncbi:glycoside hydrolase family 99-like domain-containing protein [Halopelagius longus]|nr:glycoside hydrolase family 99-like domain-containing protein [Halopelagius longus]
MMLETTRRRLLAGTVGLVASGTAVAGRVRSQSPDETTQATSSSPSNERPSTTVCAHYYPWYGPDSHWDEGYTETPLLGEYDSGHSAVIDQNLDWAEQYGIDWLSASWWGPNSRENRILATVFGDRIRETDVEYSVLYESLGRFDATDDGIDMDLPENRERLLSDLEYLQENHFRHPNYRRVNGKPIVYLWPSRAFRGDVVGAFEEVRAELDAEPYIWGNFVSPHAPTGADRDRVGAFDAISMYNPYALWRRIDADERSFASALSDHYHQWRAAAEGGETHFYPTVVPGFDNTEAGGDLPVLPRDPERFRDDCRSARKTGDSAVNTVVVTSYNEFHEGTHVEPTLEMGHALLEAVSDELATAEVTDPLDARASLELRFDRTESPPDDSRQLAFAANRIALRDGTTPLANYDVGAATGLLFGGGVYDSESDGARSWRWMGGSDGRCRVFFELPAVEDATALTVEGLGIDSGVRTTVRLDGREIGTVTLSDRWDTYELSIPNGSDP